MRKTSLRRCTFVLPRSSGREMRRVAYTEESIVAKHVVDNTASHNVVTIINYLTLN